MNSAITQCTRCDNDFSEWELENPCRDENNDPICDHCHEELYETVCPLCEEYFEVPQKWTPDQFIYAPIGVETPGLYRLLQWPFYGGPLLGEVYYFDDAIELVKPLEDNGEDGNFICPDCIKKHLHNG